MPNAAAPPGISVWRYVRAVVPALVFWCILIAGAAFLLYDRSRWSEKYDKAALREWMEERRPNRKNLDELIDDYLQEPSDVKINEIHDQLDAMVEPLQMFRAGTPLFLDLYSIEITFPERPDLKSLEWRAPDQPLRAQQGGQLRREAVVDHRSHNGTRVVIYCEYRMHAFHKVQQEEAQRQRWVWAVAGVAIGGSLLAILWVYLFLRRERRQEIAELEANQALEHAENLRLAEQVRAQSFEKTAAEAEKSALEIKSQLYAGIGIMAGSYAHNIKNLLVRPNDLLSRCLEADGMAIEQTSMLQEVRSTLGTVTERLQQILRTVRRDPSRAEMTRLDLNDLVRDTQRTWGEIARDKWKLTMISSMAEEPLPINGDLSHLQQAIENLIFNARDATFEMRNHVRDAARAITDPAKRKHALIEAASWRGQVSVRSYRDGDSAVLEVRDNGIGMTEEVRQKCLTTHFSTKRDNAVFEGYSAGMGLGLSFVMVVLEHHRSTLGIESSPHDGALFRARFRVAG